MPADLLEKTSAHKPPLFTNTPTLPIPILPIPSPFLHFVHSTHLQPPLHSSFCHLVSLTVSVIAPHLIIYFTQWYYGPTHVKLGTLVPEGPCCVFYGTRCQVYWGMTHNVVFCWYSDLISHRHPAHSGANRLKQSKKIYSNTTSYVLTAAMFITVMNNSLISKSYFSQCLCFLKTTHL